MTADTMQETVHDAPTAWQHAWKKAARADARLKATHLAVVDTYAEHYYAGREALRGVGLSVERITYWTRLGSTAARGARADLVRWGWLAQVKAHGKGRVARFALTVPEVGISGPVIPKEAATRPVKTAELPFEEAATRPLKAVKRPPRGHIPLPSPPLLPTVVPQTATSARPSTRPEPPRGRQVSPSTKTPKTAVAPRADLERAIPPSVLSSARTARSGPVLASALAGALAAGWTVEQVRAELDGADVGSTRPVGVCVYRMKELAKTSPPAAPVPSISPEARAAAISAGHECEHGEADLINPATGLHVCPICRMTATA